jgi:acetyl esterase/lipase
MEARPGGDRKPVATVNLYAGVAPGSEGWTRVERTTNNAATGGRMVRNVVIPTIEAYLPDADRATGAGVIIAPGGAMRFLSYDTEGVWVAQWLAARGIAGFVLKYRVNETSPDDAEALRRPAPGGQSVPGSQTLADAPLAVADGIRALQLVREHAAEWAVDPAKVGFMGFSAGARVTVGVLAAGTRPAFAAPIYGGAFGASLDVSGALPPVFIAVAADDNTAGQTAHDFYEALRKAGHKPEFHVYHAGGHGFGLEPRNNSAGHWIDEFYWWMESNGWLASRSAR